MKYVWPILILMGLMASGALGQNDARYSLQIGVGKSYPKGQDEPVDRSSGRYGGSSVSSSGATFIMGPVEVWKVLDNGTNFMAGAGMNIWPQIWARGRFYYHDFKIKRSNVNVTGEKYTIYGLGLDWIFYPDLNSAQLFPYAFIGGGLSAHKAEALPVDEPTIPADTTDYPAFITGGLGIEIPILDRMSAFAEFAYVFNVAEEGSRSLLPVSFGVKSYFGYVRHRSK
jgi:hypothetical protein